MFNHFSNNCGKPVTNVEIYPEPAKMKKQMTYADKKEIPFVALIGENEMQEGIISLKICYRVNSIMLQRKS